MTAVLAHIPVLGAAAVAALKPHRSGVYIDATFGRGGYTALLLDHGAGRVIAIDRDRDAQHAANDITNRFGAARFALRHGCFGDMATFLANETHIDGIVFDIGVSSPQLDDAARGFSFRHDGPLDMRMDQTTGQNAADLVNDMDENDLADLIYLYGEERSSRRIARAIVTARQTQRIERTTHLASIIAAAVPKKGDTHPATQSFQALRIAVNDELGELQRGLQAATRLIARGGYIAVVTFHSLEDRIVKDFFRHAAGRVAAGSRHRPNIAAPLAAPQFKLITNKPIIADAAECAANPRARSAKLRVLQRLDGDDA